MDRPARFRGWLALAKRVVFSEPFDVGEVRVLARAFGCSSSAVLFSALTGALRSSLQVDDWIGAARNNSGQCSLVGNRFGTVSVLLPVGLESPTVRLRAMHCASRRLALQSKFEFLSRSTRFAPQMVGKVTCSRASQIGILRHMSWKESLPVIGRLYRQRSSLREEVRWLQAALSDTRADLAQARDQLTRTTCNRLTVEQPIEEIKQLSNEPTLVLDAQARE